MGAAVAQIFNLPYRRFSTCRPPEQNRVRLNRQSSPVGRLPIANRRYSRLQICATTARPSALSQSDSFEQKQTKVTKARKGQCARVGLAPSNSPFGKRRTQAAPRSSLCLKWLRCLRLLLLRLESFRLRRTIGSWRCGVSLFTAATRLARMWRVGIGLVWMLSLSAVCAAEAWKPAPGPLMTRWAAEVTPEKVHPDYPRPQMVRKAWHNLNGLWDYALTPLDGAQPQQWSGSILVPFPIESALSGVMRSLDEHTLLWYHRTFAVPEAWRGQHVRLHFGAVDWQAAVSVNGRQLGVHRGGYDPFTLDITEALTWSGTEQLVVSVYDPTEGEQPRGKQARRPGGIFYTPSSGIWQTVWLEPVPEVCIEELVLVPSVEQHALHLRVVSRTAANAWQVEAIALTDGAEVARANGHPNNELVLTLPKPHLWSPDDPFLYDLRITLRTKGGEIESVSSYFGLRKVELGKDAKGTSRILLNSSALFQAGVLDQGFWPDGIYTAPTDEALRNDVAAIKQLGFNLARKHVKVEPDRWYYWCDKLGLLVWQDMPSATPVSEDARRQFEIELQHMVHDLGNHPSIIMWVLFNEGWGQYDAERLAEWVKQLDPSRLVDHASGWTDVRAGDIVDLHRYPGPGSPIAESNRAAVLGEFGGLGLGLDGHRWSDRVWSYQNVDTAQQLKRRFSEQWRRVRKLKDDSGLNAAVYTQFTDIETECNGLLTYDRKVSKLGSEAARAAVSGKSR